MGAIILTTVAENGDKIWGVLFGILIIGLVAAFHKVRNEGH